MTIFITSDSHFGHANIITYCHRPFASAAEMDEALVERWNAVVGPDDVVIHLGDVAFGSHDAVQAALARLAGRIFLVKGNHDRASAAFWRRQENVIDVSYKPIRLSRLTLCHAPDAGAGREGLVLHGHVHDTRPDRYGRFRNFSVEVRGYRPVPLAGEIPEALFRRVEKFVSRLV